MPSHDLDYLNPTNLKSKARSIEIKYLLFCCLELEQFIGDKKQKESRGGKRHRLIYKYA